MATLAETSLSPAEMRALERAVELVRGRFGERLVAVWLYGSRARGESPGPDSDVDLLVVLESADEADREQVRDAVRSAAREAGIDDPFLVMTQVVDRARLAERRAIRAFFVEEVDRDKVVLFGEADGAGGESRSAPSPLDGEMTARTREYMDEAQRWLRAARLALREGAVVAVPHAAYYASLNASRAALSEEDRFARTRRGNWHLFRELFVLTGRMDAGLASHAEGLHELRIDADYNAKPPTAEQAREAVEAAEQLVAAVAELLDPRD